jgi:hypothetical protein
MKKSLILICFCASLNSLQAQTQVPPGPTPPAEAKPDVLALKESSHNFGKIPQGRPATYTFEISNTGKEPLKLDNVQASCGCTTPEWSREAIAPGTSANIKVGYNAYAEGAFTKMVTVYYGNNRTKTITISGEVYKTPATSAPENASVQFLKQTNQ